MVNRLSKAVGCAVVLLWCGLTAFSQDTGPSANCSRTDKSKAPVFITFKGTDSKVVLLRLHNNSGCFLFIPTNQLQDSLKTVKQSDGTLRFEDRPELVNGRNVPVLYNLFNRRRSKNTVIVSDGCVVIMRPLFRVNLWSSQSQLISKIGPTSLCSLTIPGKMMVAAKSVESSGIMRFPQRTFTEGVIR